MPLLLWLGFDCSVWVWLVMATLPRARSLWRAIRGEVDGRDLNATLAGTAQLTILYAVMLSIGLVA